jgi:hypothetical protein
MLRIRTPALSHRRACAGGLLALAAVAVGACGSMAASPEADNRPPLTTSRVEVKPTGDTSISLVDGGTTFHRDDAGLLVIEVKVHNSTSTSQTVVLKATLFDATGFQLGRAGGGAVNVAPGADALIELTGPLPAQSIAGATIEIVATPTPTGIANAAPASTATATP